MNNPKTIFFNFIKNISFYKLKMRLRMKSNFIYIYNYFCFENANFYYF